MEYKILNTGDYLLIVDDSEIKEGDYCLMFDDYGNSFLGNTPQKYLGESAGHFLNKGLKKVISHLPLNNSPILEGVILLPPLEDEVEKLADEISKKHGFPERVTISRESFKSGYNKAKEKYKYTEENLKDIWEYVKNNRVTYKEYLQSLQQPKMPVGFKCEMEKERGVEVEVTDKMGETRKVTIPYNGSVYVFNDFKTTTNSQGLTQWVGEYIY